METTLKNKLLVLAAAALGITGIGCGDSTPAAEEAASAESSGGEGRACPHCDGDGCTHGDGSACPHCDGSCEGGCGASGEGSCHHAAADADATEAPATEAPTEAPAP